MYILVSYKVIDQKYCIITDQAILLISNFDVLNLFAEIGVILLLFVVGMEFPIEKLRKIGKKALVIAFSEGLGTFAIGFLVCQAVNYSLADSLFLALAISVTSTVI